MISGHSRGRQIRWMYVPQIVVTGFCGTEKIGTIRIHQHPTIHQIPIFLVNSLGKAPWPSAYLCTGQFSRVLTFYAIESYPTTSTEEPVHNPSAHVCVSDFAQKPRFIPGTLSVAAKRGLVANGTT